MKYWVTLFAVLSLLTVHAQNSLTDRIYFGGGGSFSANSNQKNISVFPQIGYKITDNYSAGVGIIYQYVRIGNPINKSLSNYGWSIFNRYNIIQQFFAYAEFERLSFEYFTDRGFKQTTRDGYNSLLLGGGYAQRLGRRASFNIMALYNVFYDGSDLNQPYGSPWVLRAGVSVGIF